MVKFYRHRLCAIRRFSLHTLVFSIGFLLVAIIFLVSVYRTGQNYSKDSYSEFEENVRKHQRRKFNSIYKDFPQWDQPICNNISHRFGRHQRVIAISVYGKQSNFTNNNMFSWEKSIISFMKPLVSEVYKLLPEWILRIYVDFAGSTESQRNLFYSFPNVDICNMDNLPIFGSSLKSFLPAKMWRFVPIFDTWVDYLLSRDLDSPITQREVETINIWLSETQKDNYFYIARDNIEHASYILGGLWGCALVNARSHLIEIFKPMLLPTIAKRYHGKGDQQFLNDYVRHYARNNALIFDSYHCETLGGQPYPSRRVMNGCFLGCIRPCCEKEANIQANPHQAPCPAKCRPKGHQDWIYC